jgi:hypothetical protein
LQKLEIHEREPGKDSIPRQPKHSYLRNVRSFQVGWEREGISFRGRGPVAVFLARQMARLAEVRLFGTDIDVDRLFALRNLTRLRLLYYSRGRHYPLDVLARNRALGRLRGLSCVPRPLVSSDTAFIGLAELRAVVRSPHLKRLSHLRLRKTDFGDAGVEEIVGSGILKRLRVLDLKQGTITDRGARLLANCPDAANLRKLNLEGNSLTPDGIEALWAALPDARVFSAGQHAEGDDHYLLEGDWE